MLFETPTQTGYAVPLPSPAYYPDPACILVVRFPAGTKPDSHPRAAVEISCFGPELLARWSKEKGFEADAEAWRKTIRGGEGDVLDEWNPAHLLVVDRMGDVDRLVTPHGTVRPVQREAMRDSDPGVAGREATRFLAEAAAALPGAGYLDLVGEYFFHYVYDSPNPAVPRLLGSKVVHGEIHQTTQQTLANVVGGVCRGDCDDLAELYRDLAKRQGKNALVMKLPGHAALGWVEKVEDQHRFFVLQTGPPLMFVRTGVKGAITRAYQHFQKTVTEDRLSVLYRFAGENVRSQWTLGWRVFAEPKYAAVMRGVQRDWHNSTFRQGVEKVKKLIADGDRDPANYRELAGLARRTGQSREAAGMLKQAAAFTTDVESLLDLCVDELRARQEFESKDRCASTRERGDRRSADRARGYQSTVCMSRCEHPDGLLTHRRERRPAERGNDVRGGGAAVG